MRWDGIVVAMGVDKLAVQVADMVMDMEVDMMADMVATKDFWAKLFWDQSIISWIVLPIILKCWYFLFSCQHFF